MFWIYIYINMNIFIDTIFVVVQIAIGNEIFLMKIASFGICIIYIQWILFIFFMIFNCIIFWIQVVNKWTCIIRWKMKNWDMRILKWNQSNIQVATNQLSDKYSLHQYVHYCIQPSILIKSLNKYLCL